MEELNYFFTPGLSFCFDIDEGYGKVNGLFYVMAAGRSTVSAIGYTVVSILPVLEDSTSFDIIGLSTTIILLDGT